MAIYLVVLLMIVLTGLITHPNRQKTKAKIYILFCFSIIVLISALREYTVGRDLTSHYYRMFSVLDKMSWSNIGSTSYEAGYVAFNKLIGLFTSDAQWMVAIHACFVMGVSGWFIYRNTDDVVLSTFMFVAGNTWFMYMNIMRQGMAICLMLIAIEVWKNKQWKLKRYVITMLCIAIAVSFHTTSFIMIIFIIIEKLSFKKIDILTSMIILLIGFFFYNRIFSLASNLISSHRDYADFYADSGATINIISLYWVFIYAFFFGVAYLALICKRKEKINGEEIQSKGDVLSDSFLMYMLLILVVCRVMALRINIIGRISYYFMPFTWIVVPRAIKNITVLSNKRAVRWFIYVFMSVAFIWMGYHSAADLYGTVPYNFFWR